MTKNDVFNSAYAVAAKEQKDSNNCEKDNCSESNNAKIVYQYEEKTKRLMIS